MLENKFKAHNAWEKCQSLKEDIRDVTKAQELEYPLYYFIILTILKENQSILSDVTMISKLKSLIHPIHYIHIYVPLYVFHYILWQCVDQMQRKRTIHFISFKNLVSWQ